MKKTIVVTGGAGFIGSHVVRHFVRNYPNYMIINLDMLTYAGNLDNVRDLEGLANYKFVKGDICDFNFMKELFAKYNITSVIHLAAESHVDRSIEEPFIFAQTNVMGTLTLLETARHAWGDDLEGKKLCHVSTDEVYGALSMGEEPFSELTRYDPHSPYSASKASADHFVRSYYDTYGLPIVISNCSNNYGPNQFPEKLIPLVINNIIHQRPLPIYGQGKNVRDWLYVEDHVEAIDLIFHKGVVGETYNIGGLNEWTNIDLVKYLISIVDPLLGRSEGESLELITFVKDRAGHDLRYAIDARKIERELGWIPTVGFEQGMEKTVRWYLENEEWLKRVTSGEYMEYYERMY